MSIARVWTLYSLGLVLVRAGLFVPHAECAARIGSARAASGRRAVARCWCDAARSAPTSPAHTTRAFQDASNQHATACRPEAAPAQPMRVSAFGVSDTETPTLHPFPHGPYSGQRRRRAPRNQLLPGRNFMQGLMQEWPLLCHKIIDYAATIHGGREIVTRSIEGPMRTTTYRDLRTRALRLAKRLDRAGIRLGDRVATLAWNTDRHLEVWYGLLGIGAIYHTVNPRLFREQIAWLINDAEDRLIFVDLTFVPILEAIAHELATIEQVIVLTDAAHMPETDRKSVV